MIKQLQGLRGIMCCAVILNHLSILFYPNLYSPAKWGVDSSLGNSPLNLFWDGNLAVIVFFCLSGYLIARNTKRRKTNIFSDLFSSISKRYLRLMPCVAFSILVMYILMKLNLLFHADIVRLLGDE